ncbi:histidinol-phosphate transaminase [Thiomicrospira microaerophila]|uniref:histidinol-phosphate transaminase n=1 Tax=Thiomicrospira microaerophila TaxID=406020 RepID=UPI00200C9451|nr:histidinol-phosphate transaminase [Thiomicrospira microaerophila]UQB42935.1 histidinol-phosphate transaminase [Thiomicrospira microaerophila]
MTITPRVDQWVKQLVRPEIRQIQAYHVQAAQNMIKLDAMENPYPWPPAMQQAWLERLAGLTYNRYPDPNVSLIREPLTQLLKLPDHQQLVFGNGSDELIQILMMALSGQNRGVMSVAPTFVMYDMIARFVGMPYHSVQLNHDFTLDLNVFIEAMNQHQPAIVFIAYPNNPTGNAFTRQQVEQILEQAPGLVVVDEAYNAFAEDSFIADIDRFPNLVVMRTFSKVGLAGFRLGYMVGHQSWMKEFDKIRLPYNINSASQHGVAFALDHYAVLEAQAVSIKQQRSMMLDSLQAIGRTTVYPTQANFITLRLEPALSADAVFKALKQDGILIKNLSPSAGLLDNCLRVTVGSEQENQAFLASFRKHLTSMQK